MPTDFVFKQLDFFMLVKNNPKPSSNRGNRIVSYAGFNSVFQHKEIKQHRKAQASRHWKKTSSNCIGFLIPGRAFQVILFHETFLQVKKIVARFCFT